MQRGEKNYYFKSENFTPASVHVHDGLEYLIQDHKRIIQLFIQFGNLKKNDAQNNFNWHEKKKIVNEIIYELALHASAEERFLYPLIESKLKDPIWMQRALLDNELNKEISKMLMEMDPEKDTSPNLFYRTFYKFFKITDEHMKEEEQFIFPALKKTMTKKELENLAKDLILYKEVS